MERINVSNAAAIPPRGANAPVAMNRWLVVLGAVLIQLCLGAIYAWSELAKPLKDQPFGFTTVQTQWIFGVGLATFAVVTVLGGRWQARIGPAVVVRIGGLLLGLGYALAKFVGPSFPGLVLTIGVIGGAGIGLGYVVPIAVGVKWFPDKKGLITGLAVAGFGFGALIWIQLAGPLGKLIETYGIRDVFMFYGLVFFVLVMIGSIWMKNPPEGWRPAGWTPPAATDQKAAASGAGVQFEPGQMLATPQFYMLWFMFICGAMAGLMVIGNIKFFGTDALKAGGMEEKLAGDTAAWAMGVFFAIFNGVGRIAWGLISDKLGRKLSLFLMLGLQGGMMIAFYYMGGLKELFFLGAAVIGFNFGGNFALFPAATADYFGNKTVGKNYGWVFLAYGVGGIVGPIMAGRFKDAAVQAGLGVQGWLKPFVIAGVACLVAAVLAMLLRAPRKPQAAA
jgi:OFA family oxalate/formate antiporter-like MFS transporter